MYEKCGKLFAVYFLMTKEIIARVRNLSASYGSKEVLSNLSFDLVADQCLAFVGPMGSGKTTLAKALSGRLFRKGEVWFKGSFVLYVEQQHHFKNRSNISEFYLQQRFNSSDSEDSYTIREELGELDVAEYVTMFKLDGLLDKPLLQLSNGENKRLQIVKALGQKPDWLLLDNPYLGLDVAGRAILSESLRALRTKGIQFILFLSGSDVPEFVNHVIYLEKCADERFEPISGPIKQETIRTEFLAYQPTQSAGDVGSISPIISLRNVTIRYGTKTILDRFSWTIFPGERWALKGANGAGKSTLLSLLTADNPQSYAQDMELFGRKRGTGESIWDIKRNIGHVSPEMHLYFKETGTSFAVLASGLFDLLGVTRKVDVQQTAQVDACLALFGLEYLRDRPFHLLSTGEQKMVLIARAFVKNPPVLILDEPCQGLDLEQVQVVKNVIDQVAAESNLTLIFVSHYAEDVPSCVTKEMNL
jgi:molybdate transport system ATP-binding protein